MADIQAWKEGDEDEPKFPSDFTVEKKAVLQVTDIKTNRNKYYAIELHSAKNKYRVYTHYGRTDDLNTNPDAGMRESRYCSNAAEAERIYSKILSEKTSSRKGYKELNLASARIGSKQSIGKSSGVIDEKTLKKLQSKSTVKIVKPTISTDVQDLVAYIYSEATKALVNTINASITANGIETPLGVLTLGQIDKGQAILDELYKVFKKKHSKDDLAQLSGDFYTVVPHRVGRTRDAIEASVINSAAKIAEKLDTLQLMRDMLNVNGNANVLANPEIEQKYSALGCELELVQGAKFTELKKHIGRGVDVKRIFSLRRDPEHKAFTTHIGNKKLLFHGSNAKNWVGILSRGLLLPKVVVTLGVHRTDSGWLGHGIYFGDDIDTSYNYAGAGKRGTSLIALANVALGKVKKYEKITHGLTKPPLGYDSCHGVSGTEFSDDEFVIYDHAQQKLEYLAELS